MTRRILRFRTGITATVALGALMLTGAALSGQDDPLLKSEPLPQVIARTQKEKPMFAQRQQDLLNARYDLSNRPAGGVTMSRGKAVQDGVRVQESRGSCSVHCPPTRSRNGRHGLPGSSRSRTRITKPAA